MGTNSAISWTDHTFNPWVGCQKVSPGCDHCYAESWAKRSGSVQWGARAERRRTTPDYWRNPYRWVRRAKGERQRVFCASLADVFDNQAPSEWRADLFALIRDTPQLAWLLLTKRPQNIARMLPADWDTGWRNVWLGTTCEDQQEFDRRWPILSDVPATVRFISAEPLLGQLDLGGAKPDWLIAGGESGPHARPLDPAWVRSLRDQCSSSGIAFHFKQWGGRHPTSNGCELDGIEVKEFPAAA